MTDNGINRAGYLRESFHYFHLKDTAGQELDFHFHEFDKLVILLEGSVNYLVEEQSYAPMSASSSTWTADILNGPSPARDSWTALTRRTGGGGICSPPQRNSSRN